MVERLDAMFAAGDCPDAVIVFVDAWTSRGGSQFLNSTSTGRYLDYLCDEVVPFVDERYPTARGPRPARPDRQVVGRLRRDGRADAAPRRVRSARLACRRRAVRVLLPARLPDRGARAARPLRRLLRGVPRAPGRDRPLRVEQVRQAVRGVRLRVRVLARPRPARRGAAPVRHLHRATGRGRVGAGGSSSTPCGWRPGTPTSSRACGASTSTPARATSASSTSARRRSRTNSTSSASSYSLDLFDGKHGGITYRYPGAIRELLLALAN